MRCIDFIKRLELTTYLLIFISFSGLLLLSCAPTGQNNSGLSSDQSSYLELRPEEQKLLVNKSPQELTILGKVYLESGNLGLAKLHFATALDKTPDIADAYVGLGKISMHSGDYTTALNLFSKASELDKNLLEAIIGQAQALRFDGKMNAAIEKVNSAMTLSPNNVQVLRELALLYDLLGQESLAEALHKEILRLSPDAAAAHNNFGMNQLVLGHYPEAILSFLNAFNIERNSKRIKNNLATAYALNGNEAKALKIFTDTLGEAAAHNNLGYLYLTQNKLDLAEDHLKKAINTSPKYYPKAHDNLDKLQQLRKASRN